jgi:hypothetical protein
MDIGIHRNMVRISTTNIIIAIGNIHRLRIIRGVGIFKEIWGTGPVQVETPTSYGKLSFRKWVLVLAKLTEETEL